MFRRRTLLSPVPVSSLELMTPWRSSIKSRPSTMATASVTHLFRQWSPISSLPTSHRRIQYRNRRPAPRRPWSNSRRELVARRRPRASFPPPTCTATRPEFSNNHIQACYCRRPPSAKLTSVPRQPQRPVAGHSVGWRSHRLVGRPAASSR